MAEQTVVLNKERKVTLTLFAAHRKKTPAILILPGGAYNECSLNEGKPVARKFNSLGFNSFVLCYSVGKHYKWPYPLDDLESAMEYLKLHHDELFIDPEKIVLAGFSAGGHLAGAGATIAKNKPFAAILCYPALNRSTIAYSAPGAPDIPDSVNEDTCPCFLASSRNDWIVPIDNTHRFVAALDRNFIDYEEHIYGFSMHGFSIGKEVNAVPPLFCSRVGDWVEESASWIDDLVSGRYISIRDGAEYQDTHADYFSSKNSVGLIFKDEQAKKAFKKKHLKYYLLIEASKAKIGDFVERVTVRNVLSFLQVAQKEFEKIDETLKTIPIKR
ncbi:MAG: alpha/beta hydrolase [Acutalibacteraceae bacterium]